VSAGKAVIGWSGNAIKAGASLTGGAGAAFSLGKAASGTTGAKGAIAGVSAVAQAGAGTVVDTAKRSIGKATDSVKQSFQGGGRTAFAATGGSINGGAASGASQAPSKTGSPDWARRAKSQQRNRDAATAGQSVLAGSRGGGGDASPSIKQDEE